MDDDDDDDDEENGEDDEVDEVDDDDDEEDAAASRHSNVGDGMTPDRGSAIYDGAGFSGVALGGAGSMAGEDEFPVIFAPFQDFQLERDRPTDRPTDQPTDKPTNRQS